MAENQAERPRSPALDAADAQAVDEVLAAGNLRITAPAPAQPARTARVQALFTLIGQYPVEDAPGDLVARTMARVAEDRQRRRFAQQVYALSAPAAAFHWRELIAVAAVLMIGVSLLWPVLAKTRSDAQRLACASHLGAAGQAMASYAADHLNTLPRGPVAAGNVWWNVGTPGQSNTEHLYLLARQGYIHPNALSCPSNADAPRQFAADQRDWRRAAEVSYSYQNQAAGPMRLDARAALPVLADKNPLFGADPQRGGMVYRRELDRTAPSNLHLRQGQNVLTTDGTVYWQPHPVLTNGDNIWLASGIDNYSGTETPILFNDVFLVP